LGYGILFFDIRSKKFALAHLSNAISSEFPFGGEAVFQGLLHGIDFSLNLVKNTGAAWGLFSQFSDLLAYLRIAIVLYLTYLIFKKGTSFGKKLSLTCICAGAFGNLIDQYRYGFVVDMFHFSFWGCDFPVFNVADTFIFLGAVGLLMTKGKHR
jgi:signal peptidase II